MFTGKQSESNAHKNWQCYTFTIEKLLSECRATDGSGLEMEMNSALALWRDAAIKCREQGEIVFVGNGASASIASHCAADIMKNACITTRVFTDLSMLTAMGNDEGYEKVFMLPIQQCMKNTDMLVAISSSGRSPNILHAVAAARQKGAYVATVSAFSEDNPLRKAGDCNIFVQTHSYGLAESCHAAILHYWMDMLTTNRI